MFLQTLMSISIIGNDGVTSAVFDYYDYKVCTSLHANTPSQPIVMDLLNRN